MNGWTDQQTKSGDKERDYRLGGVIPVGYMAKKSCEKPAGFQLHGVVDVYSVSSCVNDNFADYIDSWKHNGYWLFDSAETIRKVAHEKSVSLDAAKLFFYEAYEMQFDEKRMSWSAFGPEPGMKTNVTVPQEKTREGFDLVTFYCQNAPECSPLSCCALAEKIPTNEHCLMRTFEQAKAALENGIFSEAEPGPYRIFAVYSVEWSAD